MQGWAFARASSKVPAGAAGAVYLSLNSEGRQHLLRELPEISASLLREVIRGRSADELCILARRKDLTEEQLTTLARNTLKRVRQVLLRRDDLGPAVLTQIAAADDPETSLEVFFHKNTPEEIRSKILAGESCKPRGRKKVAVSHRLTDSYYLSNRQRHLAPAYARSSELRLAAVACRFPDGLAPAEQLSWARRLLSEDGGRFAGQLLTVTGELHPPLRTRLEEHAAQYRQGSERPAVAAAALAALDELAAAAETDPSVLESASMPVEVEVIVDKTCSPQATAISYESAAALIPAMRTQERGVRGWIGELSHDLPWEEILDAHQEDMLPVGVLSELCERPDVPAAFLSVLIGTHPRLVATTRGLQREHVLALLAKPGNHGLPGKVLADLRITGAELASHVLPARAAFRYLESGVKDPLWQQRTAHELSQLVVGALGEDAGLWTSYVGLLESFDGNLSELLEVVVLAG